MTAQRRWQIRKAKAGQCIQCGEPRKDSPYSSRCVKCAIKSRLRTRKRIGSKPWMKNGQGRPPFIK